MNHILPRNHHMQTVLKFTRFLHFDAKNTLTDDKLQKTIAQLKQFELY
jgi:hypothetical protein